MPTARLFRVILPVSSVEEAAVFYATVFEQPGMRISPGRHYFGCGGVILTCFDPRADGDDWDAKPNPGHVYFAVDDLDVYFGRVKGRANGAIKLTGPSRRNPGENGVFTARTLLGTSFVSSTSVPCLREG